MTAVDIVDPAGVVGAHEAVRDLVEAVLQAEGLSGDVAVAFVDESAIADLNERYRDVEGPTDVLAFAYPEASEWPTGEPAPGDRRDGGGPAPGPVTGEVVVCPRVVLQYAAEEGRDPRFQLGWTLIHGVLHLAGYDHETDQGEMRDREQALLADLRDRVQALVLSGGGE